MAFASIIGSAIGIILLIVTAYVLVGGVLTTTQIAMNAQSDMTAVHMKMLGTSITIDSAIVENSTPIIIHMRNTGSEPIDPPNINVFLQESGTAPILVPKGSISISPDSKQWRPTEELTMNVTYAGTFPVIVQLTTENGVSAITKVAGP